MKITNETVNQLPALLLKKKITMKKACDMLWEHAYRHPYIYGFAELSEDERSDFLLHISKHFPRYFSEFRKEENFSFISFVGTIIFFEKKSFLRKLARNRSAAKAYQKSVEMDYESHLESYSILEPENCVAELTEFAVEKPEEINKNQKHQQMAKETIMYLLLKSCHSIDDRHIKAVSSFIGENEEEIFEKVEKARNSSFYHLENEKRLQKRSYANYFFRSKYEMETSSIDENCSFRSKTHDLAQNRDETWRRNVFILSKRRSAAPSNECIGEVMNVNPRTVTRYLANARKHKGINFDSAIQEAEKELKTEENHTVGKNENMIKLKEKKEK